MRARFSFFTSVMAAFALGGAAVLLSACSHQILAVQTIAWSESLALEPEVTATQAKVIAPVHTIAYRPPDNCNNEDAAQLVGRSDDGEDVVSTACGVVLANFEKTFTSAGYRVVSWQALTANMQREQQGDQALERARELGVDVLFIINSASWNPIYPDKTVSENLQLFKSDLNSTQGSLFKGTYQKTQNVWNSVRRYVPAEEWTLEPKWSATIDVSAVYVPTKEAIWFYRHTILDDKEASKGKSVLFTCNRNEICYRAVKPEENHSALAFIYAADLETKTTFAGGTSDPAQLIRYKTMTRNLALLVKKFTATPMTVDPSVVAARAPAPAPAAQLQATPAEEKSVAIRKQAYSNAQVKEALAPLKQQVYRCAKQDASLKGKKVPTTFVVNATGAVASVSLSPELEASEVGKCLIRVLSGATLPAFEGDPQRVEYALPTK